MPVFPCKHPTCFNLLPRPGYCPNHADKAPSRYEETDKRYDQEKRDTASRAFYNSAAWHRVRKQVLVKNPICFRCKRAFATDVHHMLPLRERPDLALDITNLRGVCKRCHTRL